MHPPETVPHPGLGLAVRVDGRAGELILAGDLEMASVERAEAELARLERLGLATIVLDLRRIEYMDSAGVRLVVRADRRAREAGRRLAVMAGYGIPLMLLRTLGLEERLEIADAAGTGWRLDPAV